MTNQEELSSPDPESLSVHNDAAFVADEPGITLVETRELLAAAEANPAPAPRQQFTIQTDPNYECRIWLKDRHGCGVHVIRLTNCRDVRIARIMVEAQFPGIVIKRIVSRTVHRFQKPQRKLTKRERRIRVRQEQAAKNSIKRQRMAMSRAFGG